VLKKSVFSKLSSVLESRYHYVATVMYGSVCDVCSFRFLLFMFKESSCLCNVVRDPRNIYSLAS